jgi:hypothetical protein
MGKVGGERNFGYGKRMDWAGKNALHDRYGNGRFATQAAHQARWAAFCEFARERGVRDARNITADLLSSYGTHLGDRVGQGDMKVAYAQNLLSSVNVVLQALRHDTKLRISPADCVGDRQHARTAVPCGLDRARVDAVIRELEARGEHRIAAAVGLMRYQGLRMREAFLFDARDGAKQLEQRGAINVTHGTKGGRGRDVERWVPVLDGAARAAITKAEGVQGAGKNLLPAETSWVVWRDHAYSVYRQVAAEHGLATGFHDLRAAFAVERFELYSETPAPVNGGSRTPSSQARTAAAERLAYELGHGRTDVLKHYIGSFATAG